jgi:Zn-dependent protease/predicted transcriptional regulator
MSWSWSWKLGRIAGIDVYVHVTFLVLLAWIALLNWNESRSVAAVAEGVGYILALFGCVVAHEYGHALTARRYGIGTADITLLPIGGVARLERMPDKPSQELVVALAGPAVNVVIAGGLLAWLTATGWRGGNIGVTTGALVPRIMVANAFLVAFNLLPAFPMDGGRALRALLATRMPYAEATRVAAAIGQGMAVLFGFFGLFGNPMLIFIALFVWIGAGQEAGMVQVKSALAGVIVRHAMLTQFRALAIGQTLGDAVDLLLSGSQQDFPVVDDGRLLGMLSRADLMKALGIAGRDGLVRDHMRQGCPAADPEEPLEPVLARLQGQACRTLPVLSGGALVGLLTLENVGELLMVVSATAAAARASSGRRTSSALR